MREAKPTCGSFVTSSGQSENWSVRLSKKARYARISVSPKKGIEIVVPAGMRIEPTRFLEQNRGFVEGALAKMAPKREAYLRSLAAPLPAVLSLAVVGQEWNVRYRDTANEGTEKRRSVLWRKQDAAEKRVLTISGCIDDKAACRDALKRFVFAEAKNVLPQLLEDKADELGVAYNRCRIRNAHTRLGSCSVDGTIMLAACLMFYPPELVQHVLCHELAHRSHMDHTAAFHKTLEAYDPKASLHAAHLRKASICVPSWLD